MFDAESEFRKDLLSELKGFETKGSLDRKLLMGVISRPLPVLAKANETALPQAPNIFDISKSSDSTIHPFKA